MVIEELSSEEHCEEGLWDDDGAAGAAGVDQPAQHRPAALGGDRQLVEGGVQGARWA